MNEMQNRPAIRPAYILVPQSSNPIPLGEVGQWLDEDGTVWQVKADGTQSPSGSGANNTYKEAVRLASAAALSAVDYDATALTLTKSTNGKITVDSVDGAVGNRILVKNQVDDTQNGIYVVTVAGTTNVKFVLTRAPDAESSDEFEPGFLVPVAEGTVNADTVYQFTADAPFTLDTSSATFSLMPISITYATTAEIADLDSTAEGAGTSDTVARGDHKHAVVNLTGASAKVVADVNTIGGVPVLFRTLVASGANGDVDITLGTGQKIRVLDAWAVLKGAGTVGSLLTLKSTATAISDAMDVSLGSDKALFRIGSIDDANHEIIAGGKLRWSKASTGADFPGAECYVLAVLVS
jgi:hypothetical protein